MDWGYYWGILVQAWEICVEIVDQESKYDYPGPSYGAPIG